MCRLPVGVPGSKNFNRIAETDKIITQNRINNTYLLLVVYFNPSLGRINFIVDSRNNRVSWCFGI
jgi:hypothetical protein